MNVIIVVSKTGNERLSHLDSLRGLAAMGVAFHHSIGCFDNTRLPDFIVNLFGAPQVIFFFVLSGFVLSRSLASSGLSNTSIFSYLIRRFFRLYPAAVLSLVIAAVIAKFYSHVSIPYQSEWLTNEFKRAENVRTFWDYLNSLTLKYPDLNGPLWTIRVEFWCSFLLPFVLLIIARAPCFKFVLGAILFCIYYFFEIKPGYLFVFYLGYIISEYPEIYKKITPIRTLGIILLGCTVWCLASLSHQGRIAEPFVQAAFLLAMIPCSLKGLRWFFEIAPIRFLGRISYSFYLIHCPILLLTWSMFARHASHILYHGFSSAFLIFSISVFISLPLAYLSEAWCEQPWNDLGKKMSSKYSKLLYV